MATTPAFASTPKRNGALWVAATTANTRNDGVGTVGTDILLAYTAGSGGAFIDRVRLHPVGLVAATATTATVARVYLSTVTSGSTTATNTKLWQEVACPTQTTAQTTSATIPVDISMGIRLQASDTILVSMHHSAAANTGWQFTVGGNGGNGGFPGGGGGGGGGGVTGGLGGRGGDGLVMIISW